jgi:hypothetical protein
VERLLRLPLAAVMPLRCRRLLWPTLRLPSLALAESSKPASMSVLTKLGSQLG